MIALREPRLGALGREDAARAAALLDEALDLPDNDRAAWHAALQAREPQLAAVVGRLLESAATRTHRDRAETGELIARRIACADPRPVQLLSLEGRRFGPYRVLELLGQGGMGSVWRAERADGLFECEVALKLVHPALAGSALHERFERERRILGALAHPRIARLLDAGVGDDGQPYLALELIEGTPLDHYCAHHKLDVRARLELLIQVLQAVQHAHQHLVIHRDLKPANILVDDAVQVHLLDFGIAKLLHDGSGAETELTLWGGRALTPHYASPEQTAGQPVGTASDVYSLGVVLYELLCGRRPDREAPAKPSRWADDAAAAKERGCAPRALKATLAGDLDTIALKALAVDPADRYPTADALSADLQRFLAGEPVLARPASAAYRLGKFIRRHRAAVSAASAAAFVLVATAGVALWQADTARRAAAQAARENQRAQAVQAFLVEVFGANSLRQADPQRARRMSARDLLDAGAARATTALRSSPQAQEAVLDVLADMYFQLEAFDEAARLRRERALALERIYGNDPRAADAWLSYASDVADTSNRTDAAAAVARARAILDAAGDRDSETRGWVAIEAARLAQYRSLPTMRREADAALAQFRARPQRWVNLYHALQVSARARYYGGDHEGALRLHAEAVALALHHEPQAPVWLVTPWVQMAEAEIEQGRVDAAETHLREALDLARRLGGDGSASALQTQVKLGALLHANGRQAEGWALLEHARALIEQPGAKATPDARSTLRRFLGQVLIERGEFAHAHDVLEAEVAELRQRHPASLRLAQTLALLASASTALGRLDDSTAALDEARALLLATAGPSPAPMLVRRLDLETERLASAVSLRASQTP